MNNGFQEFEDSIFRIINEEILYDNDLHTAPDDLEDENSSEMEVVN
ncbi:MAG: hypothetical protein Q4G05_06200 [Clostridia bacterium]|nr:hypothetical protein [Clostridia bacterium]